MKWSQLDSNFEAATIKALNLVLLDIDRPQKFQQVTVREEDNPAMGD